LPHAFCEGIIQFRQLFFSDLRQVHMKLNGEVFKLLIMVIFRECYIKIYAVAGFFSNKIIVKVLGDMGITDFQGKILRLAGLFKWLALFEALVIDKNIIVCLNRSIFFDLDLFGHVFLQHAQLCFDFFITSFVIGPFQFQTLDGNIFQLRLDFYGGIIGVSLGGIQLGWIDFRAADNFQIRFLERFRKRSLNQLGRNICLDILFIKPLQYRSRRLSRSKPFNFGVFFHVPISAVNF